MGQSGHNLKKRAIGLLGGSFNPAHEGHLYISNTALRALDLDEVWWLVARQNPLKSATDLDDYDARLTYARRLARPYSIKISDFERDQPRSYTAKTLKRLNRMHPNCNFVWLMGADNLAQIPKWYQWRDIFNTRPVAVFDRPGDTYRALNGQAAQLFRRRRLYPAAWGRPILDFASSNAPVWTFVPYTKHKLSSTDIRNSAKRQEKLALEPKNTQITIEYP